MSTDRWINKEYVEHVCNGILLSHKKHWNNAICSNMDGHRDDHPEWGQPGERQIAYDIAYMWTLKKMILINL